MIVGGFSSYLDLAGRKTVAWIDHNHQLNISPLFTPELLHSTQNSENEGLPTFLYPILGHDSLKLVGKSREFLLHMCRNY